MSTWPKPQLILTLSRTVVGNDTYLSIVIKRNDILKYGTTFGASSCAGIAKHEDDPAAAVPPRHNLPVTSDKNNFINLSKLNLKKFNSKINYKF